MKRFKQTLLAVTIAGLLATLPMAGVRAEGDELSYAPDRLLVEVNDPEMFRELQYVYQFEAKPLGDPERNQFLLITQPGEAEYLRDVFFDHGFPKVSLDLEWFKRYLPPIDPEFQEQWHLDLLTSYAPTYKSGSGNTIAVLDTGVDLIHADLTAKILPGYDFVNDDHVAHDDNGSGTHLAGIAAAECDNVTDGAGVDCTASIMPVKVRDKSGTVKLSDLINGIDFAVNNGAHVMLLPVMFDQMIGGYQGNEYGIYFLQNAITQAKKQRDVVMVAPAGDLGSSNRSYPAAFDEVISVAATDINEELTEWSNYSAPPLIPYPPQPYFPWVDFAAPGQDIYSTKLGGGMETKSGTAQAAAQVAGAISLRWFPFDPSYLTVQELCNNAEPIYGTGGYWSCGRLNLDYKQ